MVPRRRTARPRRTSVKANALKGRPNLTRIRQSVSTQTVATGAPKMWNILSGTTGAPSSWWVNHDGESIVGMITGYVAYVPNLNEEVVGGGFFQSYAAYMGVLRGDRTEFTHGGVSSLIDPFNAPDREWMRQGRHKGVVIVADSTAALFLGPGGGGAVGRLWRIRWPLYVKLSEREVLWLATNYTDDGFVDNSSWWYELTLNVHY